jgi:hypothetical protein
MNTPLEGPSAFARSRPRTLFNALTATVVIVAAFAWFGVSLLCLGVGFESSEYEKSSERWWHDMHSCVPLWAAAVGFIGVPITPARYRKMLAAFLAAVVS